MAKRRPARIDGKGGETTGYEARLFGVIANLLFGMITYLQTNKPVNTYVFFFCILTSPDACHFSVYGRPSERSR